MGILEKFFNAKEEPENSTQTPASETYPIPDEIDSMISILENLGLLDVQEIYAQIINKKKFDINVLTRLKIKAQTDVPYVKKYFEKTRISYGSTKIKEVRQKLNEVAATKKQAGSSYESTLAELMNITKLEIEEYRKVLVRFNADLRDAEEQASNYMDISTSVDAIKNYYKEQELGYPIDLDRKIVEMSRILFELPFGGYGEDEIKKFVDAAKKMAEEGKLRGEDSVHTFNRITTDLFAPRQNRYLADVETLKKKLQMIQESPHLSELEKEQNKKKTIKDFNVMNGHKLDLNFYVDQLSHELAQLEEGGYGEEEIEKFSKRAKTMVADGKRIEKPEQEIKKEVQAEYQKLTSHYQDRLVEARKEMMKIEESTLTREEKDQRKNSILEDFHDEMGLPIDYKDRINAMIVELKNQSHGGYGELKTREFKDQALERLQAAKSRTEVRDALREIRELQDGMIRDYQEELRKLDSSIGRINQDRHLSEKEKGEAMDELDREFKFKMGYRMNFERYIENRAKDLRQIGTRGYGDAAIEEFTQEAKEIAQSTGDEKVKYDKIKQKYNAYRKHYEKNVKVFEEWKRLQLKDKEDSEKERLEQKLNKKINHMLSLSPRALEEYYLADDNKKKEKVKEHNYVAAFKFLAKQEARHRRDDTIYAKRIKELESGQTPYTQHEIDEAVQELELLSISNEELNKEDRIISVVEYIDSTLLKQMNYAETSLLKSDSTR